MYRHFVEEQIGTSSNKICEEALKMSWDLPALRREGMRVESAYRGGAEIIGESVNKLGKYAKLSTKKKTEKDGEFQQKPINCFNCGNSVIGPIMKHKEDALQETLNATSVIKWDISQKFAKAQNSYYVSNLQRQQVMILLKAMMSTTLTCSELKLLSRNTGFQGESRHQQQFRQSYC